MFCLRTLLPYWVSYRKSYTDKKPCMPTKAVPYRSSQNTPRVSFGPPGFLASAEALAPKVADFLYFIKVLAVFLFFWCVFCFFCVCLFILHLVLFVFVCFSLSIFTSALWTITLVWAVLRLPRALTTRTTSLISWMWTTWTTPM